MMNYSDQNHTTKKQVNSEIKILQEPVRNAHSRQISDGTIRRAMS